MNNLPKALRQSCESRYTYTTLSVVRMQESKLDGTRKYLFSLGDGNLIESVLMRYKFGNSVCVSSQVGCRMGCRFCAATLDGVVRNLTASEILEQIYAITRDTGEKVSHVVIMGSGEPMDNYDAVVRFLRLLTAEEGLHLSQRNITVSTCGLPEGIRKLTREGLAVNLALSLHAPTDEKRRKLMPIAERYSLEEVLAACKGYFDKTGRQLTFEYALVHGSNDTDEEAAQLSSLLRGINCIVNLIPVNPVTERGLTAPDQEGVRRFKNKLEKSGINVTIRREMGRDIDGACGQLRRRQMAET